VSQDIKKAIISNADLPPIIVEKGGYFLRYRIISEDRNRTSHWSNSILIDPEYTFISGDISIKKQTTTVLIVWDSVEIKKGSLSISKPAEYDLWARWGKSGAGDWMYIDRIAGTTTSLNHPSTYYIGGVDQEDSPNELTVEIYLKGIPISRDFSTLRVYSAGPEIV
jgi:hypothetical protein